jgi:hypothetical protein
MTGTQGTQPSGDLKPEFYEYGDESDNIFVRE